MEIQYKSRFKGFIEVTKDQSLEIAKNYFKSLYHSNEDDLINLINNKFKGISFTINDLK